MLLLGDFLDEDDPLLSVDLGDLACLVLVSASHNLDFITFTDWHGPDSVLLEDVFAAVGGHDHLADVRRSSEVRLSCLSAR